MFAALVGCYDRLNMVMTCGMDRRWRRLLVEAALSRGASRVLDLASGTGDVALLLQQRGVDVTAADFCAPMLKEAKRKGVLETIEADALNLPFGECSFDVVTIAWGFRNFSNRARALSEIRRVLKPGGGLYILESSAPEGWPRPFHQFYCHRVIPAWGWLLARHVPAYRYLARTVSDFPSPPELARQLETAGFSSVSWRVLGMGAVCLHSAES
ncbi:MAG: ubiquinone/menaquinone biosynthesis methyltransferase [Candidatus Methylacidiphilales bacterium]